VIAASWSFRFLGDGPRGTFAEIEIPCRPERRSAMRRNPRGLGWAQYLLVATTLVFGCSAMAFADTLTAGDGGLSVIDTVTTPTYGTTTIKWLADANFAASLTPSSPYWVPNINPDGSMSLSTAVSFINQLNKTAYLGITNWRLPTTIIQDSSCSFTSAGGNFGYDCGKASPTNPGYPYSELAGLFYNGLGGQAHNSITLAHNSALNLFQNLQPYLYWSRTAQSNNLNFANDFWFQNGFQGTEDEYDSMFVLPVSTTTTGTPPTTTPACPAMTPPCPGILPGLGLTTTLPPANPTLQRSADGTFIYDPTLNVTFLANANLAATLPPSSPYYVSGINPNGSMSVETLASFLAALNNPANPYLGLTGWTVPMIAEDGQNPNCTIKPGNGSADIGYNCDGQASQLGELFYDQLGGVAGHDVARTSNSDASFFTNLASNYYWQCQPTLSDLPGQCEPAAIGFPPSFSFLSGYQGVQSDPNDLFALLELPRNLATPSSLEAAILPGSRSVQAGATATVFATIVNAGPTAAFACGPALATTIPAAFIYQTTDPTTNALTGTANTPANIAAGQAQSFVIALTPTTAFAPTVVNFTFGCGNANPAPSIVGVNTLSLSASTSPVPDIVALAASGDPGYVDIPGSTGTGAFAVATVNLGSDATITAAANTGAANLPVTLTLCQTNPSTGACLAPPTPTVTTGIQPNATPTFGIFVTGSAVVADIPGINRVFVTFTDSAGILRGETSVAVRSQ
jgi:hypothetical protein